MIGRLKYSDNPKPAGPIVRGQLLTNSGRISVIKINEFEIIVKGAWLGRLAGPGQSGYTKGNAGIFPDPADSLDMDKIPGQKELEKEISDYLTKKYGSRIQVTSPYWVAKAEAGAGGKGAETLDRINFT